MKIRELNLAAFGPFTDRALVFDDDGSGLHIVYGPNEAGKSSALRGLKALLYGIDERTPDNFLHANDKLRISGCLRMAGNSALPGAKDARIPCWAWTATRSTSRRWRRFCRA